MNKYIILTGILSIGVIVTLFGLGRYLLLDTKSLFGWERFKPFPKEIRQKHTVTIERADSFIRNENSDSITSQSEKFNLELYLKLIEIGVLPYLKENDPLRQDVQLLAEDIRKYIIKDKGRTLFRN